MQPNRHQVFNRGLKLNVFEWGKGNRTVLLHHGFIDHARSWDPIAKALAEHYHVIALDARGFGDSDRVGNGGYYYFSDYVWDLDVVLHALARDSFALVGHSMGGMVTSLFSGTFPDLPRALVSVEGFGPPDIPLSCFPERTRDWITALRDENRLVPTVLPSLDSAIERLRRRNPGLTEARARHLAEYGTKPVVGGFSGSGIRCT